MKIPIKKPIAPADLISGAVPQPHAESQTKAFQAGRAKKGESWAEIIADELAQEGITGVSARREIIQRVKALARAGVPWAIQFLADREEGKAKQQVDLEAKGGGTVHVAIVKFGDAPSSTDAPDANQKIE